MDKELELRKGLGYPPFVRLANVLVWGKDEDKVKQVAHSLYADLSDLIPQAGTLDSQAGVPGSQLSTLDSRDGWLLLPPTPCVLERLKGAWRYHLVIKAPPQSNIADFVGAYFRKRKPEQGVRVSIDIDPINLL